MNERSWARRASDSARPDRAIEPYALHGRCKGAKVGRNVWARRASDSKRRDRFTLMILAGVDAPTWDLTVTQKNAFARSHTDYNCSRADETAGPGRYRLAIFRTIERMAL